MSIGTTAHAATETIVLTEVEKEFQSYIVAQEKIQVTIEAATLEIKTIGLDKIKQFTKDVVTTAKVDADRASAICKEIKTTEQKIVEKKEGLLCVLNYVKDYIRVFEETNCHAALRVWRKIRAEIVQTQTQQHLIESQISRLEKICETRKYEQCGPEQQQIAVKSKA